MHNFGLSRTHTGFGSKLALVCGLRCLVITARRDLAVIDVGMVGGMGVAGRCGHSIESHE